MKNQYLNSSAMPQLGQAKFVFSVGLPLAKELGLQRVTKLSSTATGSHCSVKEHPSQMTEMLNQGRDHAKAPPRL